MPDQKGPGSLCPSPPAPGLPTHTSLQPACPASPSQAREARASGVRSPPQPGAPRLLAPEPTSRPSRTLPANSRHSAFQGCPLCLLTGPAFSNTDSSRATRYPVLSLFFSH